MKVAVLLCLCVLSAKAQPITHGGTYTTTSFFSIATTEPVIMDHCSWSVGDGQSPITAACAGADLTIQNSSLTFVGQDITIGQLFYVPNIWAFKSLVIRNCFFDGRGQAGFYQQGGYITTPVSIQIYGNIFQNCRCAIGIANIRNDPNIWIAWNQIVSGPSNKWNDQISIYNSCGIPGAEIIIANNYIQVDPNSPMYPLAAGISAGDYGTLCVIAMGNVCVNCSAGLWWPNNNTSKLLNNKIVGRGPADVYSTGLMVGSNAGYAIGNSVAWLDTHYGVIRNYYFGSGTGQALNSDADPALASNPDQATWWYWQSAYLAARQAIGPQ